ncbi:carboxypeptidase-like regulatory domain-containing protein [Candidatus Korobacter versatilis]|uniref:carboxypeptidase-like regulatory domain-containing protein n=1 Tax=Candidatus Korobacter versatilis TaxID=658062 RepID=UPI0002F77C22|nr:carboxypeptidase-like regulatory domain-containing protein [Candidatus Koribacter versatilis]
MHRANFGSPWRTLLLAVLFVSVSAFSQDASSSAIRGIVTDASSARILGAQIAAVSVGTGVSRNIVTDKLGSFTLDMLPPGEYFVRVIAPAWRCKNNGSKSR